MTKRSIILIVSVVRGAILLSAILMAAGVENEASKIDKILKDDIETQMSLSNVQSPLAQAGYSTEGELPTLKVTGANHSMLVYTTWLNLNQSGSINGYHLHRSG